MNKKYFTIKETADLLGVTPLTLRNWDKSGKLNANRNPINNYRVYRREDIEALIGEIEHGSTSKKHKEPAPKPQKRKLTIRSIDDEQGEKDDWGWG